MAAPTPTTRVAPGGKFLVNGHPTKVTFSRDPDVSFWEKTVTPAGQDGGPPIDTTSMHNVTYVTKAPNNLIDVSDHTGTASYDPAVWTQIEQLINQEGTITERFSDGSTLAYYGYLQSATKATHQRGSQPELNYTIVATNWDPVNDVEAAPVLTSVAGT